MWIYITDHHSVLCGKLLAANSMKTVKFKTFRRLLNFLFKLPVSNIQNFEYQ